MWPGLLYVYMVYNHFPKYTSSHYCALLSRVSDIHLWGTLRYTMSSTGSPARLRYTIQYMRWKVMNMMGKMTRLYLSMSLARIPNILVGGPGGSAGVGTGSRGARVSSRHTCARSVFSRGSESTPSLTVHVSIQHVWNRTQAWNTAPEIIIWRNMKVEHLSKHFDTLEPIFRCEPLSSKEVIRTFKLSWVCWGQVEIVFCFPELCFG